MLFFDYSFLFLFLPLVVFVHLRLPEQRRNAWLLIASLVFYAASSLAFLPVLVASIVVDYISGAQIAKTEIPGRRTAWLVASLCTNLGLLGYFKYAGLLTATIRGLGLSQVPLISAALPVGISFYTFQSMSYTIDIYRRQVTPARSLGDFAAFVTLFPQLIAGPIVRYTEVERALTRRELRLEPMATGLFLLVIGLAKKLIIADTCADLAAPLFARSAPGFFGAWTSMILFAGQIYFDFSGYSDMAVGLGRLIGFEFPQNFDSPYRATSLPDFWRRWHITLSTWLRDYLYIPLGGNRGGAGRTARNLMITMLLGGLWHGASWTFVLWGGLHGLYLVIGRLTRGRGLPSLSVPVKTGLIFALVTLTWVPFKLDTLAEVRRWWGAMLLGEGGAGPPDLAAALAVPILLGLFWIPPNTNHWRIDLGRAQVAFAIAAMLVALFVGYGRISPSPFLYFRF